VKVDLSKKGETTVENFLVHLPVRLKFMTLIFALAISGIALSSVSAKADDFSFSFTSTSSDPGTVPGTVTGEILGLTNNATGPATEVLIMSFPSGLNSVLGSGPINAMLWDQQYQNSFTESGGQVTAGGFWAQDTINGRSVGAQLYINGGGPYNFLNLDGTDLLYVWGDNGFAAANIKPLGSPTPEPSSFLLALGFAGVLGAFRRKFGL
jgi:hypothetical protein